MSHMVIFLLLPSSNNASFEDASHDPPIGHGKGCELFCNFYCTRDIYDRRKRAETVAAIRE